MRSRYLVPWFFAVAVFSSPIDVRAADTLNLFSEAIAHLKEEAALLPQAAP